MEVQADEQGDIESNQEVAHVISTASTFITYNLKATLILSDIDVQCLDIQDNVSTS